MTPLLIPIVLLYIGYLYQEHQTNKLKDRVKALEDCKPKTQNANDLSILQPMSNESNLPVYLVPGTDGNPDLYYLRSFAFVPDTQITKEQFDGLTQALTAVENTGQGAITQLSEAELIAAHAVQDPATNTPAAAGTPIEAAAATTPVPEPVASTDPSADQAAVDPNVGDGILPEQSVQPPQSEPSGELPVEAVPESPIADTVTVEGTAVTLGGTITTDTIIETPVEEAVPEAEIPNGQPTSGPDTTDSNSPVLTDSVQSPTSDPEKEVVANIINNLPGNVDPSGIVTDPATGNPVDLSTHLAAEDPTLAPIPPPATLPIEEHESWWANEKQRLINLLRDWADKLEAGEAEVATAIKEEAAKLEGENPETSPEPGV